MGTRRRIDFNLDLGEGYGVWSRDNDEATLLPLATSVNLACGFHAGDPGRMRATVEAARASGVAVGAHPGLPDLAGFGRRPMTLRPDEVKDCITYQVGALQAFLRAAGMPLHHVKLHGELAIQCNREPEAARAYAEAVAEVSDAPIYTHPASAIWAAAGDAGVRAVPEFYADLPLRRDGTRGAGGASRYGRHEGTTPELVRRRVRDLLERGGVEAADGGWVEVSAATISVHSDGPEAADMARAVRAGVADAGVELGADLS